ncbi:MAG: FHA domain-containing protein [Anaerolineae bacterium]|nr:FHA domain-containing protein [Anaerolineae bacterium]
MANSTFCPVCQRKNDIELNRCAYCGSILRTQQSGIGIHTTLNITPTLENLRTDVHCQECLAQITEGAICFIIEKKQTPIIFHNVSETILGRFFDEAADTNFDLDPYGGGAFGVSRRHARIVRVNNKFVFEDLNSTNGSWLNGQRIPTGTTYPLMSGDQIWLGQFKLQVCFHQPEVSPHSIILLRDTTKSSAAKLTPDQLITKIAPYLKAISDLQAIAAHCLQQGTKDVAIEKIDASGSDSYIVVHVVNHPEAIQLIRKWITPWRREQAIAEDPLPDATETKQAIAQLTLKLIADISPGLDNDARFAMIEKALPIVTSLATSSIELSFEAL